MRKELVDMAKEFCDQWAGGDIMSGDLSYYAELEELKDLLQRAYDLGRQAELSIDRRGLEALPDYHADDY